MIFGLAIAPSENKLNVYQIFKTFLDIAGKQPTAIVSDQGKAFVTALS